MKQKFRKYLLRVISMTFIVYVIYILLVQQPRIDNLLKEKAVAEKAVAEQEQLTEELNHLISIADTDEYIEKMARERLGYVKPNDLVFIDTKD
ncbi:MAG: septum formation initiator family protein [Clostridia bacterium]